MNKTKKPKSIIATLRSMKKGQSFLLTEGVNQAATLHLSARSIGAKIVTRREDGGTRAWLFEPAPARIKKTAFKIESDIPMPANRVGRPISQ